MKSTSLKKYLLVLAIKFSFTGGTLRGAGHFRLAKKASLVKSQLN